MLGPYQSQKPTMRAGVLRRGKRRPPEEGGRYNELKSRAQFLCPEILARW
jgi:hypothetical protein